MCCVSENQGIEPPPDRLIYPIGMTVDPSGERLYVANANFDLQFNGGTVFPIDLEQVAEHVEQGSNSPVDESEVIDADATVRLGTFAYDLVLTPEGDRLFAPVRGDNSVTVIDIREARPERSLVCWDDVQPEGLPACSGDHLIGSGTNDVGLTLPSEPFALAFVDSFAVVTHTGSSEVSLIADIEGRPELVDIQSNLAGPTSGIAVHPLNDRIYVTHRGANVISTLDVFDGSSIDAVEEDDRPGLVLRKNIPIDVVQSGLDERFIAFHPDGHEAYVTSRTPDAILTLDTSIGPDGAPRNEWRDPVALSRGPSRILVHEEPGTGRVLVYAVCFDDRLIYVYDPELRRLVGILRTEQGPHAVAFDDVHRWVLVGAFTTSVLEVFDANPESDTYGQELLTIGEPQVPGGVD